MVICRYVGLLFLYLKKVKRMKLIFSSDNLATFANKFAKFSKRLHYNGNNQG